jgi:hypothetical protein
MSKAQVAKKQKSNKPLSKKLTIRDLIKEKKGESIGISLLDSREVQGTIVSIHADFFILSVGETKDEHVIPFAAVTELRRATAQRWSA